MRFISLIQSNSNTTMYCFRFNDIYRGMEAKTALAEREKIQKQRDDISDATAAPDKPEAVTDVT